MGNRKSNTLLQILKDAGVPESHISSVSIGDAYDKSTWSVSLSPRASRQTEIIVKRAIGDTDIARLNAPTESDSDLDSRVDKVSFLTEATTLAIHQRLQALETAIPSVPVVPDSDFDSQIKLFHRRLARGLDPITGGPLP